MLPEQISHYRILQKLGAGGMGEVYLAEDTILGRTVAIKLLPEDVGSDPERLRRFVQEAKAASALKHSNVAGIYELGEINGVHFIVMEHVEGRTLEQKLAEAPVTTSEILEIATQVADALDEAHGHGIIHRDIKPGNIMITPRGQAKVLDFGLAKFSRDKPPELAISELVTIAETTPGLVMGTVHYMSPEQALGKPVEARSDLFSLGILLYRMTTTKLPFNGSTTSEIINNIVNKSPEPVARFNYNVSPEVERIIRKCLEKDPDRRYQNARDLLIDLRNLKRDIDSGAASSIAILPASTRKPLRFAPAAALILIAAGTLAFLLWKRQPTAVQTELPQASRKMIVVLRLKILGMRTTSILQPE